MTDDATHFLSRKEAALYLRSKGCPVSNRTLEYYASKQCRGGKGPRFFQIGYVVGYRKIDLDQWVVEHLKNFGG